ncbi:MAG: hypothetical protein ACREEC_11830, partial [Thermoplasmata archaeon]
SPFAISLAHFDRGTGDWASRTTATAGDYFLEPTGAPNGALRVSVMEYSDFGNWSTLRSAWSPFNVLKDDGRVVPLDEHFLGLELTGVTSSLAIARPLRYPAGA